MEPIFASERSQRICCWPDCFHPPAHRDTELCHHHLHEVGIAWVRDNLDVLRQVVDAVPVVEVIAREHDATIERARIRPQVDPGKVEAVVYYLRVRGSDRVKIGTTTNLRDRMTALRADGADLLATEPGGYDVEFRRHHQFADERYGRREEFALSDRLAAHIANLSGEPVVVNR